MPQDAFQEKEVEGISYQFSYLSPRQALALWARLAKHLVPALAAAIPKQGGIAGALDVEVSSLDWEKSAGHITQLLSSEQFTKDVDLLLTTVRTQELGPVTIDQFPGRIGHVLKICLKALEVNFSDFFAGFKAVAASLKATVLTPEKTTLSGASGE